MLPPYFSRREVLKFLIDEAPKVESGNESECWRNCWSKFSGDVFDSHGHDGPYLEFKKVCEFYGFSPTQNANGQYVMQNFNFESVN